MTYKSTQRRETRISLFQNGWFIWSLAALFYAYEFAHRVSPSVMISDLMLAFDATRASIGYISSSYFYAYALFQVPAGILVDRYGVKTILMFASMTVVLGSFMMSTAHSIPFACFSRFLIGAGSAFAFVSCLKLASFWIKKNYFPFVVGLTNLCGMLGAILGGEPLARAMRVLNWEETYWLLGFIGFLISAAIWIWIKDKPAPSTTETFSSKHKLTDGIKAVIRRPQTWVLALYATLLVTPITAFAELWGVDFFQTSYGYNKEVSASMLRYIFFGIAVGGPCIGWLCAKITNIRLIMALGSGLTLLLLASIIYMTDLSTPTLKFLLFCYGFTTSHMLLCFSLANQNYPSWAHGAVLGFINMMVMGCSAIFQPVIGKLIDLNLQASLSNKLFAQLSLSDFQLALSVLPVCIAIAIGLTIFLKNETVRL